MQVQFCMQPIEQTGDLEIPSVQVKIIRVVSELQYCSQPGVLPGTLVIPGRRFEARMTTEASSKIMRQLKEMSGIVDKSNNMHGLRHTTVNLMLNIDCPE